MRAIALAISSAVLAFVVVMPPLLLAQEPPADDPPVTPEAPVAEEPPIVEPEPAPPAGEATSEEPAVYAAAAQSAGSVSMGENFFSPVSVTITAGETVTWLNSGQEDHTATGNGFDTGPLGPGASASHTFTNAGTFPYVCSLHSDMSGTVQVLANSGTDPGPGGTPGGGTPGTDGTPTGETDPTAVPGSEAAAGLEPGAAGSSSRLPASGAPQGALVALGIGLICCGLLATATARLREREILHLTDRWD